MTVSAIQTLSEVVESKISNNNPSGQPSTPSWIIENWRKIVAEFLATLMLILLGCMACIPVPGYESAVYGALGFGMAVLFNIQIFGHISGAYMNPAVTLASVMWGNISISLGIAYFIVECAGAIIGYGILDAITSINFAEEAVCITRGLAGQSILQSLGIEIAITTALILLNCAVWDPVHANSLESVSIKFGMAIVGLSLMGGPFTGASMNPARSLGPAVWTNIWTEHWVFWLGPFLGTLIGVIIYKYIFLQKPKQ